KNKWLWACRNLLGSSHVKEIVLQKAKGELSLISMDDGGMCINFGIDEIKWAGQHNKAGVCMKRASWMFAGSIIVSCFLSFMEYSAKLKRVIDQNAPASSIVQILLILNVFMRQEEAVKAMNLFEGAQEHNRRKALALTLNDTKTAVNKLNQMVNQQHISLYIIQTVSPDMGEAIDFSIHTTQETWIVKVLMSVGVHVFDIFHFYSCLNSSILASIEAIEGDDMVMKLGLTPRVFSHFFVFLADGPDLHTCDELGYKEPDLGGIGPAGLSAEDLHVDSLATLLWFKLGLLTASMFQENDPWQISVNIYLIHVFIFLSVNG
ncbi:hypothetical protein ACJX0J_026183, partial [Zea mays]